MKPPSLVFPPERCTPAAHHSWRHSYSSQTQWDMHVIYQYIPCHATLTKYTKAFKKCATQLRHIHTLKKIECLYVLIVIIHQKTGGNTFIEASFSSSGLRKTGTGRFFILLSAWPPLAWKTIKNSSIALQLVSLRAFSTRLLPSSEAEQITRLLTLHFFGRLQP